MAPKLERIKPMKGLEGKMEIVDVNTHFKKGVGLLESGKYQDSIDHFKRVLKANPDHVDAMHSMSKALNQIRERGVALQTVQRAIEVAKKQKLNTVKIDELKKTEQLIIASIDNPEAHC